MCCPEASPRALVLAASDLVPWSPRDSVVALGPLWCVTHLAGAAGLVLDAKHVFPPQLSAPARCFSSLLFSFPFFPLSYSPVVQLFNTFHPRAELPEVSCFKLNTFLFEST